MFVSVKWMGSDKRIISQFKKFEVEPASWGYDFTCV